MTDILSADIAHSCVFPVLHRFPASHDRYSKEASTSPIHHVHCRCLGYRDGGTWSGKLLAPDACAPLLVGHPRGRIFLHRRLPGQHLVYQKYERLLTFHPLNPIDKPHRRGGEAKLLILPVW